MIVITREKMTEALEWVLTQVDPDYSYSFTTENECRYVDDDGRGDCLFGRALIYLGMDVKFLQGIDKAIYPSNCYGAGINEILRYLYALHDEEFPDDDFIDACRLAQMDQDSGMHWVHCVETYKARLNGKRVIT